MIGAVKNRLSSAYIANNKVKLVTGGATYFELLLKMIAGARETIHLQTYIYFEDETGKKVAAALIEAAKRNVQVYLLADGYASKNISETFIQMLKDGGVNFRFFEPLFKSNNFYFGRRLHHKLTVVDSAIALTGGMNISNHYNDLPGHPAWLDFALYAEGAIAKELCVLCCKTWKGFKAGTNVTPCKNSYQIIRESELALVRMRRNDWVNSKNQISKSYIEMLTKANSHISILCSYFLPGIVIRKTIRKAVERGVKVKVIVAGKSDLIIAKNAERFMYDWLLRNGVELFEYQHNILHGKIAVCDGKWLTIGSYNINDISAYASVELNLDVNNITIATEAENMLDAIIEKDCIQISKEQHASSKNILKQFFRWCSYLLFRAAFFLFTFYFRQRR